MVLGYRGAREGGMGVKKPCVYEACVLTDTKLIGCTVEKIECFLEQHIILAEEDFFDVKVILNELLMNAMTHGNKQHKNKKVYIKVDISEKNQIYIIIEDEGEGMKDDCASWRDNNFSQTPQWDIVNLKESGRGLGIISCLCDSITRNEKGNKITVLKRIQNEHNSV